MPPWFADERYSASGILPRSPATEVDTIVDWCLGGAPEGERNDADAPPEPRAVDGVRPVARDSGGLRPPCGDGRSAPRGASRNRTSAGADTAMNRVTAGAADRRSLGGLLRRPEGKKAAAPSLPQSPVKEPEIWPEGTHRASGFRRTRPSLIRIRYKKTWLEEGKEIRDRSEVALSFAAKAVPIESVVVGSSAVYSVPRDVEVLSVLPSIDAGVELASGRGHSPRRNHASAHPPSRPRPEWPRTYWLEEPVQLPKGSRLRVTKTPSNAADSSLVFNIASN